MKISILTPTIRPEGLQIVHKALKRQSYTDFEWIVGYKGKKPDFICAVDSKFIEDDFTGGVWTLNRIYNKMIQNSTGELIVSWQDWTYANPDTLERFYNHFLEHPNYLVGAVGNKYSDERFLVKTWQDPRERTDQGTFYPVYFNDIEYNLASIPKKALYDVGGFDSAMDAEAVGYDGVSVNDRINMIGGYDFYLDQTIKSYSLEHGRAPDWDENNFTTKYQEWRKRYLNNPRLPYLALPPHT